MASAGESWKEEWLTLIQQLDTGSILLEEFDIARKVINKVGDLVRISKYKRKVFDKGYTPNWTEEIFVVDGIVYTNPITYKLKDLSGEEIQGSFYEQELLKTEQSVTGPFRIEKVIRRDRTGSKALVKWSGYPEKFNSWVYAKDLKDLKI